MARYLKALLGHLRTPDFVRLVAFDLVFMGVVTTVSWFATSGDGERSVLIGIFSGILVLLAGFHLEVVRTRHDLMDMMGLPREATEDREAWRATVAIAKAYDAVDVDDPLWQEEARTMVASTAARLQRLAAGEVDYPPHEAYRLGTELAQRANRSFVAVIVAGFAPHFWAHPDAGPYLEANLAAVRRNVQVTRYYVLAPGERLPEAAMPHLRKQVEGGVRVRLAYVGDQGHSGIGGAALADDKDGCFLDIVPGRVTTASKFYLSRDPESLQSLRRWIATLESQSEDVPGVAVTLRPASPEGTLTPP